MKNLYDYERTQSATVDLPFGNFKNESSPGQKDGTDIVAEHVQDLAYPLFQILQLAGVVPNGELEDGNLKNQFITALTNIGIFKYSEKITYNAYVLVWQLVGKNLTLYMSNKADNNDDLSNTISWEKILTIDSKFKLNFHVETNIGAGSGNNMPVFCFNSGPVNTEGNPALLTLEKLSEASETATVLTLHAPAVCTDISGQSYNVGENIQLDISGYDAGTYNIFFSPEEDILKLYQNNIYVQKNLPETFNINDIFIDVSVFPYSEKIKVSEDEIIETNEIYCGNLIIDSETTLTINEYNLSGSGIQKFAEKASIHLDNLSPAGEKRFTDLTTALNSLSTAITKLTSTVNGKLSATVKKAANGYIKFNNGVIIQWGKIFVNKTIATVTLPVAFSSKSYSISATSNNKQETTVSPNTANTLGASITATSFKLLNKVSSGAYTDSDIHWIAIGY